MITSLMIRSEKKWSKKTPLMSIAVCRLCSVELLNIQSIREYPPNTKVITINSNERFFLEVINFWMAEFSIEFDCEDADKELCLLFIL